MLIPDGSLINSGYFYGIHILISSSISLVGTRLLEKRYKNKEVYSFLFLLFFNIALPLIGYLFSFWLLYYLLKVKYVKVLKNTKSINLEELDQEFPTVRRAFGEGSMVDLMNNKNAPQELRMKALTTMAENMSKQNVAVIKNSLSDSDDEIRLYSFSLIDNMERGINTKIHFASTAYKKETNEKKKISYARELAFLYWEMIYFDLSDEVLKKYLIDESYKYAQVVFENKMNDMAINSLLGKINLERGDIQTAATMFIMAIEDGDKPEFIVPYLAEIYFESGNYKTIRSMFKSLNILSLNTTMHPVVQQWTNDG